MGRERETPKQQQISYTVEQLVAVNPYNPDILPDLENYVNEQVSSLTYSLDANLCLLRLYQALMAMPAPDFSLSLFLIPGQVQMEEQFKTLTVHSHYLEGFEQAIQAYTIHVLSLTYQRIPRPILAEAINIEGLSLDKFLEHQVTNSDWILEKGHGRGQLIVLPQNEFNPPELKKNAADCVPLEHITRIFPILG